MRWHDRGHRAHESLQRCFRKSCSKTNDTALDYSRPLLMRASPATAIKLSDSNRMLLERWARGVRRRRDGYCGPKSRSWPHPDGSTGKSLESFAVAPRRCACGGAVLRSVAFPGIEKDAPRGGQRAKRSEALVQQILHKILPESLPRRFRWRIRSLAAAWGTSPAMVQCV